MEFVELCITFVKEVGFPIAMCVIMLKYMHENDQRYDTNIKDLSTAIENNTNVMQKLVDKNES